ncbi:hypothetical protein FIS3754_50170 (plasmid) [Fischerella sp. NIES-3754]|nr:hypothetical protein FIS3754_50170 [Fischerella sp. NIES-3754]
MLSVAKLVDCLSGLNLNLTRIDLSIDDYQKRLNVLDILNWFNEGNFSGFTTKLPIPSGKGNKYTGLTLNCGSRESDKFVRIYDTFGKHKTKATRFEGEFKDYKAKQIQQVLMDFALQTYNVPLHTYHDLQLQLREYISNLLLSTVSFCDRTKKPKRIKTKLVYPEFSEWLEFKEYINKNFQKVKLVARLQVQSIRDKWEYLKKQVKGTLSLIRKGLSKETLHKLIDLLLCLDDDKKRPDIITKDRKLLIASMQKNGIFSILNEQELQQYYNEYGVDFGSQTSYYSPAIKEDSLTANKKVLRSLLKQNQVNGENELRLNQELNDNLAYNNYFNISEDNSLYNTLLDNYNIIEILYKNIPSLFSQLLNKLNLEQRQNILEYCEQLT